MARSGTTGKFNLRKRRIQPVAYSCKETAFIRIPGIILELSGENPHYKFVVVQIEIHSVTSTCLTSLVNVVRSAHCDF